MLAIGSSEIGGGQKVFLSLAKELHSRGYPAVVVLPEGPLVELVKPYATRVHIADLASVTSLPRIARILWAEPAGVIDAHLTKCALLFAFANLLFRRRLYCTLFNAVTHEALGPTQRRVYPALCRLLQWLADGIIVNSEQNKQHVVAVTGMDPDSVKVIYSGIDIRGFSAQQQERRPGEPFVIGAVGRLSPEKGHIFLVRALAHLKHINFLCLIAGEGPLRQELEQAATEEGVAYRIRFLGFQANVAQVMSQMDVVVMPSLDETFGLTIVEAFALRKAVIASEVGGIPELVRHGRTGWLVPPRDSAALASAIEHAFANPSVCQRIGQTAYEFAVANFTTALMADRTLEHLGLLSHPAEASGQ